MNKEEFLRTLCNALQGAAPSEIDDILADYRNHFDESSANGRSEEATAAALGDPVWLGREHLADLRDEAGGWLGAVRRFWTGMRQRRQRVGDNIERELAWIPGSRMAIRLPAEVSWRPAEQARAVLRGPAWLIEHVHLDSQQLRGRFKWRLFHSNHLRLDLEGPAIESWSTVGSADLRLLNVSQAALRLELCGSGDIRVAGRAQHVTANVMGSGEIDLSLLEHLRATVKVVGSGEVKLGPSEEADLSLQGSGDITLLTRPTTIRTHVLGSGDIRMEGGWR
ncbi:GIN domain-containing protein [Herbaspirillum camelliae]|uniref:GIN domain-containing protein n=1 Tax=Herbaspirillum camelliae TaxID=1892903 RepID=UPI000949E1E0|nr:DUF2807 domain-containing protein [Herbaspirillum camelliae]